jgi:hypothetical protein
MGSGSRNLNVREICRAISRDGAFILMTIPIFAAAQTRLKYGPAKLTTIEDISVEAY